MTFVILIPVAFALLRLFTRRYVFSALTTLSCALITALQTDAPFSGLLTVALAVSAVGDYFMAHRGGRVEGYIPGILGFLLGHVLFAVYAQCVGTFSVAACIAGLLLAILLRSYLLGRMMPKLPAPLKLPIALYTLVSLLSFTCALMSGSALLALGVGLLLFSDVMIAEADFVGNRSAAPLILPTYYLCHIFVTLSLLIA